MEYYLRPGSMLLAMLLSTLMLDSCSGIASQASKSDEEPPNEPSMTGDSASVPLGATIVDALHRENATSSFVVPMAELSCDIRPELGGDSAEHVCVAWDEPDSDDMTKPWKDCAALNGIAGGNCDPIGTVAGCRGVAGGSGTRIEFTYWYYSGSLGHVASSCVSPMTVVLPGAEAMPHFKTE